METEDIKTRLKGLPGVDETLKSPEGRKWLALYPRRFVLKGIREHVEDLRNRIRKGESPAADPASIARGIEGLILSYVTPSLRAAINATGVVLHTNLGRAPLSEAALKSVAEISKGYSNLEYNLKEGKRGKRYAHLRELIKEITGAPDATVVNNNAAAVLLALSSLAKGKEVIVSRGELVEIGGSFRVPDVMAQSGAILREVGTTNKTHLRDYERAICEETALILKVHQSNYKITGFTSDVSIEELVTLGGKQKDPIPVMFDLGSGCLFDLKSRGIGTEPVVREVLEAGLDIVTFSGDKLLGGPQAGIAAGKQQVIEKMNRNPLARALRIDKMTLAALQATFFAYADEEKAAKEIPALRMLLDTPESIRERAGRLASGIEKGKDISVDVIEDISEAGGGSLPGVSLRTFCLSVRHSLLTPNQMEQKLRTGRPPIVARIKEDALLLDARTIADDEVAVVADRLNGILVSLK
ncbi:MAG: L-seryl-tRNA(Sec) selenium transferase, partial [Nitrospiraceae bacterium]|nr:L-seryl-tRNA(Sec) selenium transferase [Nitrospiraceae bacterium]